jgi:hypothetical protein
MKLRQHNVPMWRELSKGKLDPFTDDEVNEGVSKWRMSWGHNHLDQPLWAYMEAYEQMGAWPA